MSENKLINKETNFEEGSIKDFNKTMTIFFGKETGNIRDYAPGRQDLNYYGDEASDFNYDFIVVEKDEYILNNLDKFMVQNKKLVLKPTDPQLSKYEVAK